MSKIAFFNYAKDQVIDLIQKIFVRSTRFGFTGFIRGRD